MDFSHDEKRASLDIFFDLVNLPVVRLLTFRDHYKGRSLFADIRYLCDMRLMAVLLIIFISFSANAQRKQEVVVSMTDGNVHHLTFRLTKFQGIWVIADDYSKFIRGKSEGEKLRLEKSGIDKIRLENGETYVTHALSNRNRYIIGIILTEGEKLIFKSYSQETMQTGNNMPVDYIQEDYYEVTPEGLVRMNPRKYINELAESCPKLKSYIRQTGRVRWNEVDILLGELHEMCP